MSEKIAPPDLRELPDELSMIVADLRKETTLFERLLSEQAGGRRIVTIKGDSMFGKTTLLGRYEQLSRDHDRHCAVVNLRLDPHAILDHLCEQIGLESFPTYWTFSCKVELGQAEVNVDRSLFILSRLRVSQSGIQNYEAQYRQLTMEFFRELPPCIESDGAGSEAMAN